LAAGVWGNVDRAEEAVDDEASALRSLVLLSEDLPPGLGLRLRGLIRRHIEAAMNEEWPAMEKQRASRSAIPVPLADALHLAVCLNPRGDGQSVAQQEIVASLEDALDAAHHRQRVAHQRSQAGGPDHARRAGALRDRLVHSGNPTTTRVALGVFASAVAVAIVMRASQDQPFSGQLGLDPDVLQQVLPRAS